VSGFVLDASVTIAWLIDDEAAPDTDMLMDRARDQGAVVPGIWALEVGNVLLGAERRGRLTPAQLAARIDLLSQLPIEIAPDTALRSLPELMALARSERLTTYDAAYLDLAMRRGLPLATRDSDLRAAAQRLGSAVLPD
jgi:predicted nucleic acid-binding protein